MGGKSYHKVSLTENFGVQVPELEPLRPQAANTRRFGAAAACLAAVALVGMAAVATFAAGDQDGRDLSRANPMKYISLAVSGHTALATGTCKDAASALEKVKELAEEEAGAGHLVNVSKKLVKEIVKGEAGTKQLHEIEQVLDAATLKDGMKMGMVITATDMNEIADCEMGRENVHLEEHDEDNGVEIFQGDMLVQPASVRKLIDSAAAGRHWAGKLWPEGKINYCFEPDIKPDAKQAFELAVEHVKQQVPCIHFVLGEAKDADNCKSHPSLIVKSPDRSICCSYVGKVDLGVSRSQLINLGRGCESMGVAAHELGHVLAMTHEQSRADRRNYLTVVEENIKDGKEHNFDLKDKAFNGTAYDMLSLMHYSANTFGKDGKVTLLPNQDGFEGYLGQRMGFSQLDVEQIGEMYGCKDKVTPLVQNKELSQQLAHEAEVQHAPFTKQDCICSAHKTDQTPKCATPANGYCCDPESGAERPKAASGAFCYTEGKCFGEAWDHCVPRYIRPWYMKWTDTVKSWTWGFVDKVKKVR